MVAANARTAITFALSPGQASDAVEGRELLGSIGPLPAPLHLIMDRAYEDNESKESRNQGIQGIQGIEGHDTYSQQFQLIGDVGCRFAAGSATGDLAAQQVFEAGDKLGRAFLNLNRALDLRKASRKNRTYRSFLSVAKLPEEKDRKW